MFIKKHNLLSLKERAIIQTLLEDEKSKSDGAYILDLNYFENLLLKPVAIRKTINNS
mgnify:FL=1